MGNRRTIVLGAILAVGIGLLIWFVPLLQAQHFPSKVNPADVPTLINEDRRTLAQIIGGLVLLLGLYLTYRRLIATERTVEIAQEGQITERFTRAIDQLGATNDRGEKNLEVRVGGIYALERIGKNSDPDYWTVMSVLATYVREHATPGPESDENATAPDYQATVEAQGEDITLPSILGIPYPSSDLEAALRVLSRRTLRNEEEEKWNTIKLDGASFRGRRFMSLNLQRASLTETDFSAAYLQGANFESALLFYANLEGAFLHFAKFTNAFLAGANFKGAYLDYADLEGAMLQYSERGSTKTPSPCFEGAYLQHTNLNGTNLRRANLRDAHLHHTKLEGTDLLDADLQDAHLQFADLRRATGLTQEQLDKARGDETTRLPDYLKVPSAWHKSTEH